MSKTQLAWARDAGWRAHPVGRGGFRLPAPFVMTVMLVLLDRNAGSRRDARGARRDGSALGMGRLSLLSCVSSSAVPNRSGSISRVARASGPGDAGHLFPPKCCTQKSSGGTHVVMARPSGVSYGPTWSQTPLYATGSLPRASVSNGVPPSVGQVVAAAVQVPAVNGPGISPGFRLVATHSLIAEPVAAGTLASLGHRYQASSSNSPSSMVRR